VTFLSNLEKTIDFHQLSSPAFSIQNYLEANQLSLSPICFFVKCKHIFFTNLHLGKFLDSSEWKLILNNREMEAR